MTAKKTQQAKRPVTITLQPADRVDSISDDGSKRYQRPYPFHVTADTAALERQDFWRGNPARVVGFQKDLAVQRIDLPWKAAVARPFEIIGKYVVTENSEGQWATHELAIAEVRLDGEMERWLVGGLGHWGQGLTKEEAKANFTRFGGRLSDGYDVVRFGDGSRFRGVDSMGGYSWTGGDPDVVHVPARKARSRAV